MGIRCDCGGVCPEGGSFCPRCGRPLTEEAAAPAEVALPAPKPAADLPPVEINFDNPVAVRAGLLAAVVGFLLAFVPLPPLISAFWLLIRLVGVGFLSIHLYRLRARQDLTVRGGARMGLIAGIFTFVFNVVILTLVVLAINTQMLPVPDETLREYVADPEQLHDPAAILLYLAVGFCFLTSLTMIGGALGAKVLERE